MVCLLRSLGAPAMEQAVARDAAAVPESDALDRIDEVSR
jgi:sulfur carrier protein ThiS